jgi:hypothetical protein
MNTFNKFCAETPESGRMFHAMEESDEDRTANADSQHCPYRMSVEEAVELSHLDYDFSLPW